MTGSRSVLEEHDGDLTAAVLYPDAPSSSTSRGARLVERHGQYTTRSLQRPQRGGSFAQGVARRLRRVPAWREKPASKKTIAHYMDTLLSFEKSLILKGKPAVVGQLTPSNVRIWVA